MNAASEDIKDLLVADTDLDYVYATDLFIGILPDTPDNSISIIDRGGQSPELRYEYERPSVQILIRGVMGAYLATQERAQAVSASLHGIANTTTINSTRYVLVQAAHSPLFVGNDKENRPIFSINFDIQRTSE